jgi:hypothetical protein
MTAAARTALVFPPHWYYASVPADLLVTGSHLRAAGVPVTIHDLSAGLSQALLGAMPAYQSLRRRETYADRAAFLRADEELRTKCALISADHEVRYSFYNLSFGDLDDGHLPTALRVGLDEARNPALRTLTDRAVPAILAGDPEVIAVALVHPDQILEVIVLGRLLRQAGFRGFLTLYGAHEDVLSPEDLTDDLVGEPRHLLFQDYDGAVIGEAESALVALARARAAGRDLAEVPSLLAPAHGLSAAPPGRAEDVRELGELDFRLVDPAIYPYPTPVVDLRLSRSCPWGRCTFCAITSHQAGYRARPTEVAAREIERAHQALGSEFFRFRDDLLTPAQFLELSRALAPLPFRPRWSARARFENGFSREVLAAAASAGLEELWLGLESAVPRVRNLMVKGVAQGVVERILGDAAEVGIRVRALCMLGYPGETLEEARATLAFVAQQMPRLSTVAVTPFQLMRNTPLGREPERFGLRLRPDTRPRHERLRYKLDADYEGIGLGEVRGLMRELELQLGEALWRGGAGPTLSHAWMQASLERRA